MKKKFRIFLNGKIYTLSKNKPFAEALVIKGNKIVLIGHKSDTERIFKGESEIVDLKGKIVLPGFFDSHLHLLIAGFNLLDINLSNANSRDSFQEILLKKASEKREYFTGGNWNERKFNDYNMPTKEWIDSVIPNKPVFLTRSDLHLAVANSCALKLAGINRNSPDPEGGIIVKDNKSGEPNGLLKESAMKLVERILPERSKEDKLLAISRGMEIIKTHGITSITELHDEDNFELFEELYFSKKLTARINYAPILETVDNFTGFKKPFSAYNNFLCRSAVKAFTDGSFGSSTAWFFEPYNDDPSNFGLPTDYFATKKLQSMANRANKNNVQLIIHAIGDRAISETIDLFKSVNTEKSIRLARHRIEHCQHMTEKDFLRFQKLKIIASLQPSHITLEGNCCCSIIGSEREKLTYALNSFRKHNVKMIFGSDWPVVSPNVLTGIYYAVTRKLNDQHSGWIPEQRISVSDAVEAYTINGAYSMFQEKLLGSIEVGKLADLVVLDRDIFEIHPEEIRDVKIDRTVLNGEDIFRAS